MAYAKRYEVSLQLLFPFILCHHSLTASVKLIISCGHIAAPTHPVTSSIGDISSTISSLSPPPPHRSAMARTLLYYRTLKDKKSSPRTNRLAGNKKQDFYDGHCLKVRLSF